jgi:Spy/CpxP family protein refolding chaperone
MEFESVSSLFRTKIILGLAGLFLAGMVAGAALGWASARQRSFRPPSGQTIQEHLRQEMRNELGLTPDQVQKLEPILEQRIREFEALHARSVAQGEEIIRASNARIMTQLELTEGQRAKLEALDQRRREMFRRHGKGASTRPPPGPPPASPSNR